MSAPFTILPGGAAAVPAAEAPAADEASPPPDAPSMEVREAWASGVAAAAALALAARRRRDG